LIGGWTAEHFGISAALLLSGSGMFIGALLYLYKVRGMADTC
jgi:hypothetical protein